MTNNDEEDNESVRRMCMTDDDDSLKGGFCQKIIVIEPFGPEP